jgi:hypothetical protein
MFTGKELFGTVILRLKKFKFIMAILFKKWKSICSIRCKKLIYKKVVLQEPSSASKVFDSKHS